MTAPVAEKVDRFTAIPEEDRTCVTACCCYHWALYFKWPNCCGGEQQCECICCETTCSVKCLDFSKRFYKLTGQCFCVDNRCAIPCDDEVPCLVSVFGLECYRHKKKNAAEAPVPAGSVEQAVVAAPSQVATQ